MISLTEILGTIDEGKVEVCATAVADYSAGRQEVSVELDAFCRKAVAANDGEPFSQPWLPRGERVTEHLPREDADAFARDVFGSWVKKVRASVPAELKLRP